MKKITVALITLFLIFNISVFAQRGEVVDVVPLGSFIPSEIMETLELKMDELNYALIDLITYKKYSVSALKIIYVTIDGQGNLTQASGVVFFPELEAPTWVPVFSYLHGTLTRDIDVPSGLISVQSVIGAIMAMDGYIAVLPDYIGLGDSPGRHPFSHAATEASAAVDLFKAALHVCLSSPLINAKPNGNLYLSGYSQGAHAALATQREIERNPLPGLNLRKTVAGGGAYSLSYIQKNFLFDHPEYPNPAFLPYIILGYQEVYENLYSSLGQVFVPPYCNTIPDLFNRTLTIEEIDSQLPVSWQTMFVPKYLRNIRYGFFHPVNVALRDNDLINWKPKNDLYLYYCGCDELVSIRNSLLAYLSFKLKGSRNVTCLPLGPFSHNDCAPLVQILAKIQFDCATGINPCGLNLLDLLRLTKSAPIADLSMFENALNPDATLDVNELMTDKNLTAYFDVLQDNRESLTIYPNPASDRVMVEFPSKTNDTRLCVYDIMGKMVINQKVTNQPAQIDVYRLQPGLYKVMINGDDNLTGTFMIVH